jgi:chromate reductase, NAD(P)H dehydrogenase (quinone)
MAYRVLGLCGSLRQKSFNRYTLRAAGELMPESMTLDPLALPDLPFYNQEIQDRGFPEPLAGFAAAIERADALLIVSPEYNTSLPAVLKNAIDWLSRLPKVPFQSKPVAILSASTGLMGGGRMQYEMRRILVPLGAMILHRPEVFIGSAASKFDAEGRLTDETTRKMIAALLATYSDWIGRVKRMG